MRVSCKSRSSRFTSVRPLVYLGCAALWLTCDLQLPRAALRGPTGATVRGKVKTVSATGRPPGKAEIVVIQAGEYGGDEVVCKAGVAIDGSYFIQGLPPGKYSLVAQDLLGLCESSFYLPDRKDKVQLIDGNNPINFVLKKPPPKTEEQKKKEEEENKQCIKPAVAFHSCD